MLYELASELNHDKHRHIERHTDEEDQPQNQRKIFHCESMKTLWSRSYTMNNEKNNKDIINDDDEPSVSCGGGSSTPDIMPFRRVCSQPNERGVFIYIKSLDLIEADTKNEQDQNNKPLHIYPKTYVDYWLLKRNKKLFVANIYYSA